MTCSTTILASQVAVGLPDGYQKCASGNSRGCAFLIGPLQERKEDHSRGNGCIPQVVEASHRQVRR